MHPSHIPESPDNAASHLSAVRDSFAEAPLLINRQRVEQADWSGFEAFLSRLSAELAGASFSVCLLSDRGIRRYNKRFRSKDQATDVLSFPAGSNGTEDRRYLGDILISVETARANAALYGLSLEAEMKILTLHGLLHLMGYDHETDGGRMAREERRWCSTLGLDRGLIHRHARGIKHK